MRAIGSVRNRVFEPLQQAASMLLPSQRKPFDDGLIVAPVTAQSYSVPDVRLLHHKLRGAIKRMLDGTESRMRRGLLSRRGN